MAEDLSFLQKSDDEIRKDVIVVASEETGIRNFKSTGVLRGLLETFSRIVSTLYRSYLTPIYQQTNLETAGGRWLSMWGLMLGVVRLAATKTLGLATVSAYADGALAAGTWITVSGTSLRFRVTEDVAFVAGAFQVPVEAEFAGSQYNISDDPGLLTRVIAGIESVHFGPDWITSAGTDEELDEAYRARISDRWMSQGQGNPPVSFEYYAMSVSGVKEIKLIRTPRGYGTVDVIVVSVAGIPSQALLDDVYQALYDHALICNDLQVKGPQQTAAAIDVVFSGEATENEVQEAVLQHVYSLGIGGKLEIREIYATLDALGLESVEVLAPARDISADEDSIIVAAVTATKV